jgi:hypothetical protein
MMHSTATRSLAAPVPGPAQFRGLPCASIRYRAKPGVTEAEMFHAGRMCVNPPAPGLVYCLLGRLETPGEYIELEVYADYATLLHSFRRVQTLTVVMDFMREYTVGSEMWVGYLAHLPRKFQPVWRTAYEDLGAATNSSSTGRSRVCEVSSRDTAASCGASPPSSYDSSEEMPVGQMFDDAFWTLSVPYDAELDTGSAMLLAVGMPHTYEPEPIRALVAEGCDVSSVSSEGGDSNGDDGGMIVVPNEAAAVSKVLELCTLLGFHGSSLANPDGYTQPAAESTGTPSPAGPAVPRPRNVVVRFASGPHRRCFADVAEQLGGRTPAPGDSVVVRLPGATNNTIHRAAALRLGTVVSVSAWCKRKSLNATVEPSVIVRFATDDDAAAAERNRRQFEFGLVAPAASSFGFGASTGICSIADVVDVWCSLDAASCTVVVAAAPAANRRSLANALRQHVSGALRDAGSPMDVSVIVQA